MKLVRHIERPVKVEERAEGEYVATGYAAVFYRADNPETEFELWKGFRERIMPGAFDRAISEGDDVRALFNHDPSNLLGRTKSGTLKLSIDEVGLRYEVDLPKTSAGMDVHTMFKRGDLDGSSFGFAFREDGERIVRDSTGNVREVRSVRLFDVGPVTYPAYAATTSGMRSEERSEWQQAEQQERQKEQAKAKRDREIKLREIEKH